MTGLAYSKGKPSLDLLHLEKILLEAEAMHSGQDSIFPKPFMKCACTVPPMYSTVYSSAEYAAHLGWTSGGERSEQRGPLGHAVGPWRDASDHSDLPMVT